MDNLRIDGTVKLAINGDPARVISFAPDDVLFAERFYSLMVDLREKEQEYKARAAELDANQDADAYGIPTATPARIALMREACDFMRTRIDGIFGAGTSEAAFGEYRSIDMIEQFLKGITPYVAKARNQATAKYTDPVKARREAELKQAEKK